MLVLTRQRNETVIVGDDIYVTVVDIRGDKVRLGFTAPRQITVYRKEVYDVIRKENAAASAMQPADLAAAPDVPPESVNLSPWADNYPRLAEGGSDPFLRAAIEEALQGLSEGGLPIGSVLVRGDQIIGRGRNRRVQDGDPMAHAEIDCLKNAGRQKTYRDTVLYSTLMPCHLCSGAVVQFGIPKIVVGESVNFTGAADFLRGHGVEVVDRADAQCADMLGKFIREFPELWKEDIGK